MRTLNPKPLTIYPQPYSIYLRGTIGSGLGLRCAAKLRWKQPEQLPENLFLTLREGCIHGLR